MTAVQVGLSGWTMLGSWLVANILFVPFWMWIMRHRRRMGGN